MTEIKRFLVSASQVVGTTEILVLATDAEEAWKTAHRHLCGTACADVLSDVRQVWSEPRWVHRETLETTQHPDPKRAELGQRKDLGWKLHVALRKGCDSKAASLVGLMVDDPAYGNAWSTYLDLAWVALCRLETLERDDIAGVLAGAVESMGNLWISSRDVPLVRGVRQLLLALELLGREDWQGMTYGLIDDDKDEVETP